LTLLAGTPASQPLAVAAAPPAGPTPVIAALDRLDAWVGPEANGDRWRKYLRTEELRAELALGHEADPTKIARALQQFRSGAKGLEMPLFESVRQSLSAWLTELKNQSRGDLPKFALAAGGDHVPLSDADVDNLWNNLRAKAQAALKALATNPTAESGWKKYLGWDLLEPHLNEKLKTDRQSLADLDEVLRRLHTNQPGLERPQFPALAAAIQRYRALITWAAAAREHDTRPDYQQRIAFLSKQLQRHLERPTTETSWQVGRSLGVIDALGQSPELVRAVRARLAQPNVVGVASANFITRMPDRSIDTVRPVRDCILGTAIFGTSRTLGGVRYVLNPSDDTIELAVLLEGTAHSRTRGFNGPVRINANSRTGFWAMKRISLSDQQFTSAAGVASANTNSHITSITKTGGPFLRRLIEKIAWQRAGEQKGQSERIAARHAEQRVLGEFDKAVATDLAKARQRYESELRAPLIRRGISPEYLRMSSTTSGVSGETVFAARRQLAAAGPPPKMAPGHDLALQIHESAVNNYLPLALASARVAQDTADKPAEIKGHVPMWMKGISLASPRLASAAAAGTEIVDEVKEKVQELVPGGEAPAPPPPPFKPYSITLNAEAPVIAHFDDGKIAVRIRAAELTSEDSAYKNWDFIVTYEISQRDNQIVLKRTGDIEVFPTGFDPAWDTQLTGQQAGFRNTLAGNMNARARAGQSFPAEIPIEPIRLSRFGVLVLQELVADDGWLTVGWKLPPPGALSAAPGASAVKAPVIGNSR